MLKCIFFTVTFWFLSQEPSPTLCTPCTTGTSATKTNNNVEQTGITGSTATPPSQTSSQVTSNQPTSNTVTTIIPSSTSAVSKHNMNISTSSKQPTGSTGATQSTTALHKVIILVWKKLRAIAETIFWVHFFWLKTKVLILFRILDIKCFRLWNHLCFCSCIKAIHPSLLSLLRPHRLYHRLRPRRRTSPRLPIPQP